MINLVIFGHGVVIYYLKGHLCYSKMKTVSACCLTTNHEQLLLGTEGGNILILDVKEFSLMEQIIYQDVVMQK